MNTRYFVGGNDDFYAVLDGQEHIIQSDWTEISADAVAARVEANRDGGGVLAYTGAVQNMLDNAAKAKRYDSILSACSYAAFANPFQAEGQSFVAWRGAVWAKCYEILGEVEAGTRAAPTVSELLAEIATTVQTPGADNDTGS